MATRRTVGVLALFCAFGPAAAACSSSGSSKAAPASSATTTTAPATSTTASGPAPIGHVFVINLENENYTTIWSPGSPAVYLNRTLRPQGQLLTQYYGIGHASLDNYLAQISGQAPNPQT